MYSTYNDRGSFLGQNNFIDSKLIMNPLHKKTHFKAATSIYTGENGTLSVKHNQLNSMY